MTFSTNFTITNSDNIKLANTSIELPTLSSSQTESLRIIENQRSQNTKIDIPRPTKRRKKKERMVQH